VAIQMAKALDLLRAIANDLAYHDDLRVVAHQWLRSPELRRPTQEVIRTRGVVRARGQQKSADTDWQERGSSDPSSRIRWLSTLSD
jgi:hypothetical protein